MSNDNKNFYEQFDWNQANLSSKLQEKIQKVISLIPKDVISVIDVGCGDGTITNSLENHFSVFSLDRSLNALKLVSAKKKIMASASQIPAKDNSFDLLFSSEMIEHLPNKIFYEAIEEFKRVSRKYIFLTFPNDENIEKQLTKCPNCGKVFNKTYHLQRINLNRILALFPEYELLKKFEIGEKIRVYNNSLGKMKHNLCPAESWIPEYWTKGKPHLRQTMCPECQTKFTIPYKFNLLAAALDFTNVVVSPKKKYQLGVLLGKKD